MSRATRSVISDPRRRSMISFRQYLMPKETEAEPVGWNSNNSKIDSGVLLALGDRACASVPLSLMQRIIDLYKKIGVVIRPDSMWLLGWYVVLLVIIIYFVLEIGLLLGFGQSFWQDELQAMLGVQIGFIIILLVDMLISPVKAYYEEGLLIKEVSLILKGYVRGELWVDVAGVLAVAIPLGVGAVEANWVKLLWLGKLWSMSRMLGEFERMTQLYIVSNTILLVIKLVILAYFYSHFMGIFFYRISLAIYNSNYYGPNTPNITWVYNSWAFYQMAFLPWYQMYAYIMYFAIAVVTTIAYGDITPKNPIECIYIIWALIFQTIIWGYIISEILRLLINVYTYNFQRRYHHYALNFKLKKNMVSDRTFQRVQQHTQQIDRDEQYRNRKVEQSILDFLPPDPLYGLLLVTYRDFLQHAGFSFAQALSYKSLGPADSKSLFLENLMRLVREQRFFAGDVLFGEGELEGSPTDNHCAYYFTASAYREAVALGVGEHLEIRSQDDNRNSSAPRSFELKRPKRCFGQLEFLTGQQRSHWAICTRNCLLFVMPRSAMLANYSLLSQAQKQSLALSREGEGERSCFVCKKGHFFLRCPFVFAASWESADICVKVGRRLRLRVHDRTRLRTLSAWRLFSSIRQVKMPITWEYKRRLFYDRQSHGLFVELELEEDFEEEDDNLEEELQETEVIIENVYRQELEELGVNEEEWNSDITCSYRIYKPEGNVQQLAAAADRKRTYRRNRRMIRRIE